MSKDYAIGFYSSTAWKTCREVYKKKMCYLCESCGEPASEVHHIKHLTPDNIDNPEVTLNESNLMCLCHKCHMNIAHGTGFKDRMKWIQIDILAFLRICYLRWKGGLK